MPPLNVRQKQPMAAFWYSALGGIFLSLFILLMVSIFASGGACTDGGCGILSPMIISPLMMLVILIVLSYPVLDWYLFTYEVSEKSITVNSGIIFRQYETIDFGRIQTVDNERGPLLWLFGLTMVKIWTASADQVSFEMHGGTMGSHPHPDTMLILRENDAQELKDFMMRAKAGSPGI